MLNERVSINKKCVFLQLVLLLLVFVSCCAKAQLTKSKCKNWQIAEPPNYETNVDLNYPYSNQLFQDELPECSASSLKESDRAHCIDSESSGHKILDFWGEGRIVTRIGGKKMITGFTCSYNVNHQCQEVSNSSDAGRKIPNRIPVKGYGDDVCLAKYIADNSFSIITIMGGPIVNEEKTISEMLRVIKKAPSSAIITYGYDDSDLSRMAEVLQKNNFIKDPYYRFSNILLEPTPQPVVVFTYQKDPEVVKKINDHTDL